MPFTEVAISAFPKTLRYLSF